MPDGKVPGRRSGALSPGGRTGMLRPLILAALAALVFYGILPVAGAFSARARWRAFRRRLLLASEFPLLEMRGPLSRPDGLFGDARHYGAVEAIQGEDRIWTRGEGVTAVVCLKNARIYLLPAARKPGDNDAYDLEAADEALKLTPWKRLSGLEEGARLYAAGKLKTEAGLPVFEGTSSDPLLVLIYDGRDEDLEKRALWAGRHRNEYWNPVTQVSLTAGFLSTGAALYSLLRPPLLSLPAALTAALAFSPILPFLPPGLLFLFAYRSEWTEARRFRARRDLIRSGFLDGEFSDRGPAERQKNLEACVNGAKKSEFRAGLAFSVALLINFVAAVFLVRTIIR